MCLLLLHLIVVPVCGLLCLLLLLYFYILSDAIDLFWFVSLLFLLVLFVCLFVLFFCMSLFVRCCCVSAEFKLDCRTCLWSGLFSAVVVLFVVDSAAINFVCMLYGLFCPVCLLMCVSLCLFVCCGFVFARLKKDWRISCGLCCCLLLPFFV